MGSRAGEDLRVLRGSERLPVPASGLTIGRGDGNDVEITDETASRRHAVLRREDGRFVIEDCGSANGTLVNGEPLRGDVREVAPGDLVQIGSEVLRLLGEDETEVLDPAVDRATSAGAWRLAVGDAPLCVGRDRSSDVPVDDPNVSRFHLRIERDADGFWIEDLGSRNGTWVGGRRVERARLQVGDSVRVGTLRVFLEDEGLVGRDGRRDVCLRADNVRIARAGNDIVSGASLTVRSGELVAIIGRSGCGKTTLTKALAGVTTPDEGTVTLDGDPISSRLPDIGYLPQDESVHPQLTPREALGYAARLRLPSDVGGAEVEDRVGGILEDLQIAHRADTRIARLSGGERKRTGLAAELLGDPEILFLDEPTTGLDPGLEAQTMQLLHDLARGGPGVVVVTHATASLDLCDRLVVMGAGGRPHYVGPPRDALEHFGVEGYEGIYDAVAAATPPPPMHLSDVAADRVTPAAIPRPRMSTPQQFRVLVSRYVTTFVRDRRNLAISLVQVPILGVALGLLLSGDVFQRGRRGNPNDAAQLLFLLTTTALWLGAIAAAREIVKEKGVLARERAIGVSLRAYLSSKVAVLFGLIALEAAALTAIVVALRPLHVGTEAYLQVFALVILTGCVAAALGLALSAAARSQDQATTFIPLALVPQLLFAGALVPVSKMGPVMEAVSAAMPSRWSFSSIGTSVDLAGRLRADPYDARYSPFKRSFFDVAFVEGLLALGAFLLLFGLVTMVLLRRDTER